MAIAKREESPEQDVILEVRDARVTFDMERGESRVLDDVSIDIQREEILGIVGESGSGKSMFADALLDAVVQPGHLTGDITYYPSQGGPIAVNQLSEDDLRELRWEEISMVFQGAMSSWNPTMTIKGHFKETLRTHDEGVEEGLDQARQLLSDLYLDPDRVLESYPHELSGGMSQRALIALALVLEPQVLVMDEPTASLDLLMQRSIISLLRELKEKYELTLVFISHNLPLVSELSDRLAVKYAFEFIEIGPTEEILRDAAHPYTRALLNSTPDLETPNSERKPIEGSAPDPVDIPDGCSYHPRCPLADEQCVEQDPALQGISEGREAACFHWEDAAEEIPFTLEETSNEPSERSSSTTSRTREETVLTLDDVEVYFEQSSGLFDFRSEPEIVQAVDGVSLEIAENDVIALIGESGCGKTTLGKTAIGLQKPTDGAVKYRGQDIWDAKANRGDVEIPHEDIRRALQIIHQDPGSSLNPNRKVKKILEEPLRQWQDDLDAADREARILGLLKTVGMSPPEDYAGRYPHQLSGGEKQRIALIRALLMNPDVILADEAISALDVSLRIEMMDLFLDLQDQFNTSFLYISHDLSNAQYLAEQADGTIGIMYLGEMVEKGPAEEVLNDPRHPYTKALRWATPDLRLEESDEELPLRSIDIPDPVDPPSGCRFHTRCPEAREVCKQQDPEQMWVDDEGEHFVTCFRENDDHEYWESPPVDDRDPDESA